MSLTAYLKTRDSGGTRVNLGKGKHRLKRVPSQDLTKMDNWFYPSESKCFL